MSFCAVSHNFDDIIWILSTWCQNLCIPSELPEFMFPNYVALYSWWGFNAKWQASLLIMTFLCCGCSFVSVTRSGLDQNAEFRFRVVKTSQSLVFNIRSSVSGNCCDCGTTISFKSRKSMQNLNFLFPCLLQVNVTGAVFFYHIFVQ